jgi:hypothetical protein
MSSFRFLRQTLTTTVLRARPLAQVTRTNLRPAYTLPPTIMAAKRSFTVNLPQFSSGDGNFFFKKNDPSHRNLE